MKLRVIFTSVLLAVAALTLIAAGTPTMLGQARTALPGGCVLIDTAQSGETYWRCPPATPTPTVTASSTATVVPSDTPLPPSATATATLAPSATVTATATAFPGAWTPPDGMQEFGDQPPAWVMASIVPANFNWPGNTPNENRLSYKHSGFKGFAGTLNGEDVYAIIHFDTNPSGEASRFHSAQIWIKDATGAVSYFPQWMDFGPDNTTQTGPNIARYGCDDTGLRPVILVNVQLCPSGAAPTQKLAFSTWYPRAQGHLGQAPWYVDLGISASPIYYHFGAPTDPSTWIPTGSLNLTRRLEVAFYASRTVLRGSFYTTQFGHIVSGPNDPLCGTPYTVGTRTYTVVCLRAYIAPTIMTIQFPLNNFQKDYPGPVQPPN